MKNIKRKGSDEYGKEYRGRRDRGKMEVAPKSFTKLLIKMDYFRRCIVASR